MAFSSDFNFDPAPVDAGELLSTLHTIIGFTDFDDNLQRGRFVRYDNGTIKAFDGTGSPTVAGVLPRDITGAVEHDGLVKTEYTKHIDVVRMGLITVRVKDGDTPARFGRVFVSNEGDDNDGMATTDSGQIDANAEFLHELKAGVWVVFVTPAPGDVSSHIGSTTAHAAEHITLDSDLTEEEDMKGAMEEAMVASMIAVDDPGDGETIEPNRSAFVPLVTTEAGGETRTLADPAAAGITLDLALDTDGGDCVVTAANAVNQTGNNTITFDDAGEHVRLAAVTIGGDLRWRVVASDGAALTTV